MNEQAIALLEKLGSHIGTTSAIIVQKYTGYYFADGLVSVAVGFLICLLSFRWKIKPDEDEVVNAVRHSVKWIAFCIGLVIFACAFPVLLNPEAKAIHQLIRDIRG